jgi:hypothetical protein
MMCAWFQFIAQSRNQYEVLEHDWASLVRSQPQIASFLAK